MTIEIDELATNNIELYDAAMTVDGDAVLYPHQQLANRLWSYLRQKGPVKVDGYQKLDRPESEFVRGKARVSRH